jgi:hypothetical protein
MSTISLGRTVRTFFLAALAFGAASSVAFAADDFANGCVSCHVVGKDGKDHRISTALKAWTAGKVSPQLLAHSKASMPAGAPALKGKHPSAADSLEDIPAGCMDCHDGGSKKAPPFDRLIHLVHLTGAKNDFVEKFKGDCTACHKLDTKTGEWRMAGGAEK